MTNASRMVVIEDAQLEALWQLSRARVDDEGGMGVADGSQGGALFVAGELVFAIGAEEGEMVLASQLVPKFFQCQRTLLITFVPEDGDHFAERADSFFAEGRILEQASDQRMKTNRIGMTVPHEEAEDFGGVKSNVLLRLFEMTNVVAGISEFFLEAGAMRPGSDDNTGFRSFETFNEVGEEAIDEKLFVAVNLDEMLPGLNSADLMNMGVVVVNHETDTIFWGCGIATRTIPEELLRKTLRRERRAGTKTLFGEVE
jgi:hypothetical protein